MSPILRAWAESFSWPSACCWCHGPRQSNGTRSIASFEPTNRASNSASKWSWSICLISSLLNLVWLIFVNSMEEYTKLTASPRCLGWLIFDELVQHPTSQQDHGIWHQWQLVFAPRLWCWHSSVCSRCPVAFWCWKACVVFVTSVRDTSTNLNELTWFEDRTPSLCGLFVHLQSSQTHSSPGYIAGMQREKHHLRDLLKFGVSVKMQCHLETKTYLYYIHSFLPHWLLPSTFGILPSCTRSGVVEIQVEWHSRQ